MFLTKKQKTISLIVFSVYFLLLVWLILFKFATCIEDIPHMRNINLIPFSESMIVNGRINYSEMIYNILVFVPSGVYICIFCDKCSWWKKGIMLFGLSLLFEILQYVFAIGGTDITDVINNTLGGIIGIFVFKLISLLFPKKHIMVINIIGIVIEVLALAMIGLLFIANN